MSEPDFENDYVAVNRLPVCVLEAQNLIASGALSSVEGTEKAQEEILKHYSDAEWWAIFLTATAIARHVNSTLLSVSSKYGSAMRMEKKVFGATIPNLVREAKIIADDVAVIDDAVPAFIAAAERAHQHQIDGLRAGA